MYSLDYNTKADEMRRITELAGLDLKWEQPHALQMEYFLKAESEIAATLRFRSAFSTVAVAESADGSWTFNRYGFFHTGVAIRTCNPETNYALFKNNTWDHGGTLEFPDGRQYLAKSNFWMTRYSFCTVSGEELLAYQQIGGFVHASAMVSIKPQASQIPELPVMTLLGWYLIILAHQDSAAAAAA